MAIPERELTEDGHEAHFATNHLGPLVFTTTILPSLRRASSPRIVNVSSWGHHLSPVLFDDLNAEKTYEEFARYGHSKTANILFAVGLARRGLCAVSLHPGVVRTPLLRHLTREDALAMGEHCLLAGRLRAGILITRLQGSSERTIPLASASSSRVSRRRSYVSLSSPAFPGFRETDSFFWHEPGTSLLRLSRLCKASLLVTVMQ